jgi:hypothetical protein
VAVRDCELDKDLSIAQRRNARPPTQPHIACGVDAPTQWTDWNPWEDPGIESGGIDLPTALETLYQIAGGLQAEIDTRSAGFRTVPGYFARIDGPRVFEMEFDGVEVAAVLDGRLSIVEPTATGFRVRVIVLQFLANRPPTEPGTGGGSIGLVAGGGFDVSALMLGSLASFVHVGAQADGEPAAPPQPEGTPEPTIEDGAPTTEAATDEAPATEAPTTAAPAELTEAGEESQLLKLVAGTWQVGWMGVEG